MGNISLSVRHSHLSILPDDKAKIFIVYLLIPKCSFSSLIVSSIAISFYILSKGFFQKRKELSDARVVSITKYSTHPLIRMLLNSNFRYFKHIFKSFEFASDNSNFRTFTVSNGKKNEDKYLIFTLIVVKYLLVYW